MIDLHPISAIRTDVVSSRLPGEPQLSNRIVALQFTQALVRHRNVAAGQRRR